MRFVIVGPGALGTVFAAALAHSGHDVTLLGRPSSRFEVIRSRGLHLRTLDGTVERLAVPITDDPSVVARADVVVVLVKSGDTSDAMERLTSHLRPGTTVLTLQNGLDRARSIRAALGQGPRVLQGVTSQAATRIAPDLVFHAGEGPTLIGFEDEDEAAAARQISAVFSQSGLPAAAIQDIERWVWRKAAINASINGLTALGGFANGVIASSPGLLDAAETVAEEAAAVARAQGIELGGMRRAVFETVQATADNRSSMLQDLEAGRETEVDAIHGAIQEAAANAGIETPAITVLAALIRAKTSNVGAEEPNNG